MQVRKYSLCGLGLLLLLALPAQAAEEAIDYEKLDLSINLSRMRAGNHDAAGENSYYFKTTVFGLPVLKDEIKKRFEDRVKIERLQGSFAEIKIKTLKYWQPGKKPDPLHSLAVSGDVVREIVADSMRTFQVPEEQVAILLKTEMFEHNKKLMFFGDDIKVGEVDFYLIPETLPRVPSLKNSEFLITDTLGTLVGLSIVFKDTAALKKP